MFSIGVARIFENSAVFTEIESEFSAEIGSSNDFSAQNQVISKKKKRSSPKLRAVFRPKPLPLLLLYCLITVMCAITEKKLQLNIVRLCCHNFLSLVEFWLGGTRAPWAPPPLATPMMFSTFPLMVSTMSIYRSDLNGDVEELSSLTSESKTSLLFNRKAKLPRRWVRQLNFLLAESENFLVVKSESKTFSSLKLNFRISSSMAWATVIGNWSGNWNRLQIRKPRLLISWKSRFRKGGYGTVCNGDMG